MASTEAMKADVPYKAVTSHYGSASVQKKSECRQQGYMCQGRIGLANEEHTACPLEDSSELQVLGSSVLTREAVSYTDEM